MLPTFDQRIKQWVSGTSLRNCSVSARSRSRTDSKSSWMLKPSFRSSNTTPSTSLLRVY